MCIWLLRKVEFKQKQMTEFQKNNIIASSKNEINGTDKF